MVENKELPLIIDNGSGMTKAGVAGENGPRCIFPSIIGFPKDADVNAKGDDQDYDVGFDVHAKIDTLNIKYPIQHGVIENWDDMEKLWQFTFSNELKVNPSDYPVLLTEAPLNPKANREKMTSIMFETFGVSSLYIGMQAVLSLFSLGKMTGLTLDVGDGLSAAVPIVDGFALPHAIHRLSLAGRDVTDYLVQLLAESGKNLTSSAEREIVRDMKEKLALVSLDYDADLKESSSKFDKKYELPDGSKISVGNARFRCAELLFQPSLQDNESNGIVKLVSESILKSNLDIRKDLYANIVLSGGSTLLPNIEKRLEQDLTRYASPGWKVDVNASAERRCAVWIGGSLLSSLSTFNSMMVTKKEYEEVGSSIIHKKCF